MTAAKPSECLARNIRAVRAIRRIHQEDLAKMMKDAGYQWTDSTVSAIETGHRQVTTDELVTLANMFGLQIHDLLTPLIALG